MTEEYDQETTNILREISEGRHTVHSFMNNVAKAEDTTKVGNLKEEELGTPILPVRSYKELALFCNKVAKEEAWNDYFRGMSEILTSTSLSKEGFLVKAAITTKKEMADTSPIKKENKGWFKKKESDANPMVT